MLEPLASRQLLEDKDQLFLARCWYFDGKLEQARRLLETIERNGFKDKTLYFTLGNIAEKNDDLPTAITWWEKSVECDPQYAEAMFNIGVGYYKLNRRDQAVASWKKTLLMNPDAETRKIAEEAVRSLER